MPEWERNVVDEVALRLAEDPYWGEKLAPWREGKAVPFAWHLAVFVELFLSYVLDGTKKVESRFLSTMQLLTGRWSAAMLF